MNIIKLCKDSKFKIKSFNFAKLLEKIKYFHPKYIIKDYIIAFKQGKLLETIKSQLFFLLNKLAKKKTIDGFPEGLLGVSINNDKIVLVHLVNNDDKNFVIKSKGIFEFNITDFDFQDLEQNEKIQNIISNYIQNNNLLQIRAAYVLSNQQYVISLIELPSVADLDNSKEKAILLGIKDYLNYPLDDAMLDSFEIPVNRSSDNIKLAYSVAMQAKLSQNIGKLLAKSNIHLKYIDISELCIRNIVSLYPEIKEVGCLVLKIFDNNNSILLMKNKDVYICRNTTLDINQLDNFDPVVDNMPEKIAIANNLLSELQRSLDYANNMFRTVNFNTICVLPSGCNLEKTICWLKEQSGLPVYNLDLHKILGFSDMPLKEQANWLLAIGAALRNID